MHGVPCEIADADFAATSSTTPRCAPPASSSSNSTPSSDGSSTAALPIDFSDTPGKIWGPPPLVGQHTREIMHEYGFDEAEIDKLVEVKAVFEQLSV